ncbi:DeoR/GlpR family DNA-binding transcription regulator [Thalassobacillus pellis]|uniref:DeoR/GlpR family DNA-binding transcription regulator n=1 Tax=Thalassobacillus pellis TaxID=748008 RepID=UPI001961BD19|nr:DeoR/GlpR family DNA-binding transcription regulator [Thalassobacillus pellis]MBM7551538.1 DeoR/GlpR family transcriptional regulator of sugar metabolism [Thalassobacillus pellis]
MIVDERRNKIKAILAEKRSVKASDLAKEFSVSEETIRRDLSKLEKDGLVKKNYGGAILVEELKKFDPAPVEERQQKHYKEKKLIGEKAGELVEDEQIIIIDAGTTTWHLSRNLQDRSGLMVISNALNIAEECSKNDTDVFVLGGKLRKKTMSMVGPQAEAELAKYNAAYTFLGTSGISPKRGFTSFDLYEAAVKGAMVDAGNKIVILADHSKFNKEGLVSFAQFKDVDILVTSDLVDKDILKQIKEAGIEVIVTPVADELAVFEESS